MSIEPRDVNGVRYYNKEGIDYVSVTSVISYCHQIDLSGWIAKVGKEEADRRTKEAVEIGNMNHKRFELHYSASENELGEFARSNQFNPYYKEYLKYWKAAQPFITNYQSKYSELQLFYSKDGLNYAGTTDSIGTLLDNTKYYSDSKCTRPIRLANGLFITDLKNKKAHKYANGHYLIGYCLQLGAYSLATDLEINGALIAIASSRQLNLHYLTKAKLEFYQQEFLNCVKHFQNKEEYNWEELETRAGYFWNASLGFPDKTKNHKLPTRLFLPKIKKS